MREHFPTSPLLNYALQVEALTTAKKPNLILNVDGCIAVCFVDLLRECGNFTAAEANEYINIGSLNALFVLGRTTGFIGHFLDQKRLKQVCGWPLSTSTASVLCCLCHCSPWSIIAMCPGPLSSPLGRHFVPQAAFPVDLTSCPKALAFANCFG